MIAITAEAVRLMAPVTTARARSRGSRASQDTPSAMAGRKARPRSSLLGCVRGTGMPISRSAPRPKVARVQGQRHRDPGAEEEAAQRRAGELGADDLAHEKAAVG